VNNELWPPNEPLEAECAYGKDKNHPGQKAPVYDCTCGYWAFSDPDIAAALPSQGYFKVAKVFGCVEAWGDIVWHENGFRAEWMVPRAVVVLRGRLHAAYEIPRYQSYSKLFAQWDLGAAADDFLQDS
jgi:hypothetical protein